MLKCYNFDIVCREIPDHITLALNIAGCPNRCEGCHSPWLREDSGHLLTDERLCGIVAQYANAVTCVCFMGGDNEPNEVERLARIVRRRFPHLACGWYSGCDSVAEGIDISTFDYLKIGSYRAALGGLDNPATNQRLYRVGTDGSRQQLLLYKH